MPELTQQERNDIAKDIRAIADLLKQAEHEVKTSPHPVLPVGQILLDKVAKASSAVVIRIIKESID